MATQQAMPWEEYQSTPAGGGQGVVIPAAPEKPREAPAGYQETPEGLTPITGGPADPVVIAAQAAARKGGEGKTATEIELQAKGDAAAKRADTIRSIMGRVEDLYKADIAGQPASRLGGLTEYIGSLPKNDRFNAASNAMLPLIRPLVAQSAKEGDSDKEMQVFMAYIPQSSDSDIAIEEKLNMLKTLIGGMVDGKVPSQVTAEVFNAMGQSQGKPFTYDGVTYQQGQSGGTPPPPAAPTEPGFLDQLGQGVSQGLGSLAEAAGNTIGIVGNPLSATINAATGSNLSTDLGTSAREMLGLPENRNEMANAIIQGAGGAMTGAGAAGALARTLPGMAGRAAGVMAAQPIQQVAGGAGAGAGAEFAREQGGGAGAQLGGALLGGMAGAGVAGITQALAAPRAAMPEGVAAAERANIPVMTSDVAPPTTFMGKAAQAAGERIPIAGTGGMRATQQEARVQAVKNVLSEYGAGVDGLPDKVWSSLAAKRSADLTKYSDLKKQVIGVLNSAGEVPVVNATKAIDDEMARLSRISPEGFAPAVAIMRRWKSDLQGKGLADIEVLRKQIGEEFKSPELAAVSGEAQKSLNRIYAPLRDDMTAFIRDNGGRKEATKWMVANKRLSEMAGELDKSSLKSVLRTGDVTPEAVNRLLFSQKRSDVAALYRNLTPQGRANARAAIMDKVFQDIGGDLTEISPEKFISAVRKQGNAIGVMFDAEDAAKIGGLVKALKLTRRAGDASVMTNTGQQVAPIAGLTGLTGIVSGLMGGASTGLATGAATLGAAGTIGLLARAMESRAARSALMQLRNAKPSEEAALVKRFISAISATEQN